MSAWVYERRAAKARLPGSRRSRQIADQQHADHQLGVNRGAARVAVILGPAAADEREIKNGVDAAQQVMGSE